LFWDNSPTANITNVETEIYASLSPVLYITVTSISNNVITTSEAHGLLPGMPIYPREDSNGLVSSGIYYVLSTPSTTAFTVTNVKNSNIATTLINGTGLSLKILTGTLIATVPVPTRSYVDTLVNDATGRVEKYYWVRHKVIKS
jgi:hypothetical protein